MPRMSIRRTHRRRRLVVGHPLRNGWRPATARAAAIGLAPALLIGAAIGGVMHVRTAEPDVAQAVAADTPFTFVGFGHGHGRGMGQWGAYGYASQHGWSADRILGHYYGATAAPPWALCPRTP